MKFVHAFGYALAAFFATAIVLSLMGAPSLPQRLWVEEGCAALGAFVGWNRTKTDNG